MATIPSSRTDRATGAEPVDTRAPAGPDGRLYMAPFAAVWDGADTKLGSSCFCQPGV